MAGKTQKSRSAPADAVALLKADHRQVEAWFAQFSKSRSNARKQQLAEQICAALRVHTEIEKYLFDPAYKKLTADKDMHHEAVVEHAGAKELIAQIEEMSAGDDYFEAKVTVLS